eukprot:1156916-Pelagomonas_calceolata.AAC.9
MCTPIEQTGYKRISVPCVSLLRLLLTAVLLAAKCYEDTVYNNIYFAKGWVIREMRVILTYR